MRSYGVALLLLAVAAPAQATTITSFTSRMDFEQALASFMTEEFEDSVVMGSATEGGVESIGFAAFSVSSIPNALKILDAPVFGVDNSTPGGAKYLYVDTDTGLQGSVTTIVFSTKVRGVGFDYSQLNEPGAMPIVEVEGQEFPVALNPSPFGEFHPLFLGFISDEPLSEITIKSGIDSAYGIDRVTFAFVPEPHMAELLLLGLVMLSRRTRR